MSYIDRLKTIWAAVYEPKNEVQLVIEAFFHPDYKQCINGVIMSRSEYIHHVIEQKKNIVINHIEYLQHLENNEELFVIYYPKGKTLEGLDIEAEVISYFQFYDEKIIKIHGQVRLIKGKFSDVDMQDQ